MNDMKWIPISEMLPDERRITKGHGLCHVLITHRNGRLNKDGLPKMAVDQAVFVNNNFTIIHDNRPTSIENITAWMYLPYPYEKESENEK